MTRLIEPVRTATAVARPGGIRSRVGWTFILLTALAIVAYSAVPYFTASLADLAGQDVGLSPTYAAVPPFVQGALYVHIVGGAVAVVCGPLQFWRGLRMRAPRVHRWIGRVYLVAVTIGAVGGLVIAPSSPAGYVGLFGFGALAVLWLLSGWRAYRAIRRHDVPSHQAWMIRNYALTYSGVMLRIWLPLLLMAPLVLGLPWEFDSAFANAYAAVPFLCWLPNLVFAEWLIRRRGLPSYRLPVLRTVDFRGRVHRPTARLGSVHVMRLRVLSLTLIGSVLLLPGCASAALRAPAATVPTSPSRPVADPSPSVSTPPDAITVAADRVEVTRAGATGSYPFASNGEELLTVIEEIRGQSPSVTDVEDPWGNGDVRGQRYEWPDVIVTVIQERVAVTFLAMSVGRVPVATEQGVSVGSSRDDVTAAGGFDLWDEDADGVADHLGLGAVEVPGTRSLAEEGEVGVEFVEVGVADDAVWRISAPANDFADI